MSPERLLLVARRRELDSRELSRPAKDRSRESVENWRRRQVRDGLPGQTAEALQAGPYGSVRRSSEPPFGASAPQAKSSGLSPSIRPWALGERQSSSEL